MLRYLRKVSASLRQLNFPTNHLFESDNFSNAFITRKCRTLSTDIESFYGNIDYDKLTKGDNELLKKLKVIMLEVDVMRQEGGRVPQNMTTERWSELLNAKSRNQRLKNLGFWWTNEKKKENDKQKKELKRLAREESSKTFTKDNGHIFYGFGGSTIFIRIYDATMDRFKNWKLFQAMLYNPTLVIDCGYDKHMNNAELSNCAKQLSILFAENRSHIEPFNLQFCNAARDSRLITKLHKHIPTMYDIEFPMNLSEKCYMDMYSKEKLVYLTPHCREELKQYNDDDIYIIGAMVDKVNNEPLSLAKAKAQGIRMAKFPLDRFLDWGIGTKSLTINQSLSIMLDLKFTNDWEKSLNHVPKRKIRNEEENIRKPERVKRYKFDKLVDSFYEDLRTSPSATLKN